jgi:hypothetical protein
MDANVHMSVADVEAQILKTAAKPVVMLWEIHVKEINFKLN